MSAHAPLLDMNGIVTPHANACCTPTTGLVIVCCHAVCEDAPSTVKEDSWRLQSFQRSDARTGKPGEHETFLLHILAAAMIYSHRPSALVMFSGGQTTDSELSEAKSYEQVLGSFMTLQDNQSRLGQRVALEEHATDSYQNLLFSILRFRRLVGRYPETVTVITHAFKERRFFDLHAAAIKWPRSRLRVQGVSPPFTLDELEQTQRSELKRGYKLFAKDLYGVQSPLSDKRTARNWDPRVMQGLAVESEVEQLLRWTGGESGTDIYPGTLPWEPQ
ncbi:hypothetical protein LTR08_007630 [Meristemomyces frigidus]|nr:hypothetical protein LTR08_007630 [Meristemomyces frigidus]